MEWRALLAGVLLALFLCLVAILADSQNRNPLIEDGTAATQWYELAYAKHGNYMEREAISVLVRAPQKTEETTERITIYKTKPAREIIYLNGPWIGSLKTEQLRSQIEKQAREAGWDFYQMNITSVSPATRPRIIILPSGAWPYGFDYKKALDSSGCLYYIGLDKNISILVEGGEVVEGEGAPFLDTARQNTAQKNEIRMVENEPAVYTYPATVDEIDDYEKFTHELVAGAASCMKKDIAAWTQKTSSGSGATLLEIENNEYSDLWVRIQKMNKEGKILRMWDERVEKLDGKIETTGTGGKGEYRVQIWPQTPQKEQMKYYAHVFDEQYKQSWAGLLGVADLAAVNQTMRRAFFASFEATMPQSGVAIIEIKDQYGRVYARTFSCMAKYSVRELEEVANEKRFLILNGTEPAVNQYVMVGLAGSDKKIRVPLRDGKLSVASEWKEGANSLEFNIDSQTITYSWEGREDAPILHFAKMLIWLLPVFGAVYFFVRAKKQDEYSIIVEQEVDFAQNTITVEKKRLEEIVSRPMDIAQITKEAQKEFASKTNALTTRSITDCLDILVKEGTLTQYAQIYAPAKSAHGKRLREIYLLRRVNDILIGAGIEVKKHGEGYFTDLKKRVWMIAPEKANVKDWHGPKNPEFLVFESEGDIIKFESGLPLRQKWAREIMLSKKLGRTRFVALGNIGEFSKYG